MSFSGPNVCVGSVRKVVDKGDVAVSGIEEGREIESVYVLGSNVWFEVAPSMDSYLGLGRTGIVTPVVNVAFAKPMGERIWSDVRGAA
jgi:hypothetical protein